MPGFDALTEAFARQELFEDKTWQLSPSAFALTDSQLGEIEAIGAACADFHRALEILYLKSATGKNLLRNRPLEASWVADYLDRGKPDWLVDHARSKSRRGTFPTVLRPDLLLTDDGFALTELDSVPGGIGLTAFLCDLYRGEEAIVGGSEPILLNFHASLAGLRPELTNPVIAIVVSEEAATYRPEMVWLAGRLQERGFRVHCLAPEELFPLGGTLCFDHGGTPEKIDIIYRFFELFDLENIQGREFIIEALETGEVAVAPPLRPFQEEKLSLALFHHHRLRDFWAETLSKRSRKLLSQIIPRSWILDPAPVPPGGVLDGPMVGGFPLRDWQELAGASQKERDLIVKRSGFHETAWGARSVVLGSDVSKEEWGAALAEALVGAPGGLHILQEYRKPKRARHPVFDRDGQTREVEGRVRLCPYYFAIGEETRLSGILATFCPPDKKIIHGMQDAALVPCRRTVGG
ncbi:MAG: hypothetical protein R3F07_06335 [Opitutaceae bacterium]